MSTVDMIEKEIERLKQEIEQLKQENDDLREALHSEIYETY